MSSPRSAGLPGIAAVLVAIAVASTPPAWGSDTLDARFEVFGFAGLHVLTNRTSAEETPKGYALATNLGTRGLASVFVDLRSHSEVYGTLSGDTPRPETYRAEVWRNGADRSYGLSYRSDGSVINDAARPAAESAYLDGVQMRGTVDQLTAYFWLERQLTRHGSCNLVVPVFDGNELYRLRFSDVKEEVLSADGYQNFAGPTRVCQVVRDMIVANPDKKEGTYDKGRIWYARLLPGDRVAPVRMQYDTPFGQVEAYLAELIGYGVHLDLMGQ